MAIMSRMLNCWASNPHGGSAECAKLEIELKGCMGNRVSILTSLKSLTSLTIMAWFRLGHG